MSYVLRPQGHFLRTAFWVGNTLPVLGDAVRNWLLGYRAPFTSRLGARVPQAKPGHALVELPWSSRIEAGKYARALKAEVMPPFFSDIGGGCLLLDVRPELEGGNGSLDPVAIALLCTATAQSAIESEFSGARVKMLSLQATFGYQVRGQLSTSCVLSIIGDVISAEARIYAGQDDLPVATVVTEWVRRADLEADNTGMDPLALLHAGEAANALAFLSQVPEGGEAFLSALEMTIDGETGGTVVASSQSDVPVLPASGARDEGGGAAHLDYENVATVALKPPGRADLVLDWSGDTRLALVTSHWRVKRARSR